MASKRNVALALSGFCEHDADAFAVAASRSRALHGGWAHPPTTARDAAELARQRQGPTDFGYLIRAAASAEPVGYVEITNIVRGVFQSGYLGYYMFEGHQRRGVMRWALGVVVRRAWAELKLHRLEANIQCGNDASIALVRSLGFQQEGVSPKYLKLGGRWRDHERWAILRR